MWNHVRWIGALGAFMTGSNTNSNVLFGLLQTRTAELLGYSLPLVLAAQTAGGAVGSIFAPTKIVVGASTAGMAGQEGLRGVQSKADHRNQHQTSDRNPGHRGASPTVRLS